MTRPDLRLQTIGTPHTEFDVTFLQGMIDRMGVSFHKYGFAMHARQNGVNILDSMETRLQRYRDTGNTEWLIDAANFLMMEFMDPAHPDAHYRPTDSDESPGRETATGTNARSNGDVLGKPRLARSGD